MKQIDYAFFKWCKCLVLQSFSSVTNLCAASWEGYILGNGGNCFLCLSSLGNFWSKGEKNRKRIKCPKWGNSGFHQHWYVFYWAISRWRKLPYCLSLVVPESSEAQDTEPRASLFLDLCRGSSSLKKLLLCHSHNPSCSSSSHFKTQPKRSWCCCACLAFEMRSVKLPQQPFWGCWLHFCFCHPFLCGVFFCFLKCEERRICTVQIQKSFHNLSLLSHFFSFSEVADYGGSLVSPFFSLNNGAHLMWRVQRESALPTIWSLMFGFGTGRWGRWACLQNLEVCFHVRGFQGLPFHPALLSCPAYHCEQCCGPGPLLEVWYALSSQAAVSWFTVFAVLCLPEAGLAQLRSEM